MRFVAKACLCGAGIVLVLIAMSAVWIIASNAARFSTEPDEPLVPEAKNVDPPVVAKSFFVKYEVIDPAHSGQYAEWDFWVFYVNENGTKKKERYRAVSSPRTGLLPWMYSFVAFSGDDVCVSAENILDPACWMIVRIYVDGALVVEEHRPSPVAFLTLR